MTTSSLKTALLGRAPGADATGALFKAVLAVFAGSMFFSVAGMLLLWLVPASMKFFGPYLRELVVGPTWLYMGLLPVLPALMYAPLVGWKRVGLFVVIGCCIGGGSELIGTNVGIPFGAYFYGPWLGAKILGDVPYLIPPSWFAMSILSLDLAGRVTGRSARARGRRILLAAVFMVLWDVSLDPAMNGAGAVFGHGGIIGGIDRFWSYPPVGPEEFKFYYGMPWTNWLGWFGVTLLIVCGYEFLAGGLPRASRWAPLVYLLNCLFPLVLCVFYGLYVPALLGAAAAAVPFVLIRFFGKEASPAAPARRPEHAA